LTLVNCSEQKGRRKMRRVCMVFIALITSLFFLASCSQQNQETSTHLPQNTPQTSQNANNQPSIYYPGKIILEVGNDFTIRKNQYIYGGIVSNSIVIHIIFGKNTNNAHAISLYFPAHKDTIITLPGTKRQFVVDYVDWQKGTIKMHQKESDQK